MISNSTLKKTSLQTHNVYGLQKCKLVNPQSEGTSGNGFLHFLMGLPSGPCLERDRRLFSPTPPPLPQKGGTPHPTGTARMITHGKKSDSFLKLAVARQDWVTGGCPGGLLLTTIQVFCGRAAGREGGRALVTRTTKPDSSALQKPQDNPLEGQ